MRTLKLQVICGSPIRGLLTLTATKVEIGKEHRKGETGARQFPPLVVRAQDKVPPWNVSKVSKRLLLNRKEMLKFPSSAWAILGRASGAPLHSRTFWRGRSLCLYLPYRYPFRGRTCQGGNRKLFQQIDERGEILRVREKGAGAKQQVRHVFLCIR